MKKLIAFALALVCSMGCVLLAQEKSPYVVTLEHEGNLQTFYGPTGFEAAYNAASDGDVITLPAQTYYNWDNDGITIKKAVTIRGTRSDGERTSINTELILSLPQTNSGTIYLEGLDIGSLNFKTSKANVSKCMIKSMGSYTDVASPTIIRCQIDYLVYGMLNASIFNSVIKDFWPSDQQAGTTTCVNCVLVWGDGNESLFLLNCIIGFQYDEYLPDSQFFPSTSTPMYNIDGNSYFRNIPDAYERLNNKYNYKLQNVYKPDTFYELTDEAKTTYLGDDGTEVGIYGGPYPYNEILSTPTITKLNVSKRTVQGETLKIEVEVK